MLKLADLKTALADKAELQRKLDEATANLSTAQADLIAAQAEAAAEKTRADGLQAQIEEANTALAEATAKVTTLEAAQKTVSQAAVEKLHELGVPAAELPKGNLDPAKVDNVVTRAEFDALSVDAKNAFFRNGGKIEG